MSAKLIIALAVVIALVVGALGFASWRRRNANAEFLSLWESPLRAELFVQVDTPSRPALLEDWRWKVGDGVMFYQATVFGDLFLRSEDGAIHFLDTGRGTFTKVAASQEEWETAVRRHGPRWFRWPTLSSLRGAGVGLGEGEVFSWRHSLMLGGAESADNVDVVSLVVHAAFAAQSAVAIRDLPEGQRVSKVDFQALGPEGAISSSARLQVVINAEEQYSVWPAGETPPGGWKAVGKEGTQEECLTFIAEVWTDLRPLSQRKQ
jgi:MbtH protein